MKSDKSEEGDKVVTIIVDSRSGRQPGLQIVSFVVPSSPPSHEPTKRTRERGNKDGTGCTNKRIKLEAVVEMISPKKNNRGKNKIINKIEQNKK